MTDYLFDEMLNRRANVTRPTVEVDGDGLAREAQYQGVGSVALRVRPVRATLDAGLLGKWPRATAVAYLAPGTARALDRLAVVLAATALAEAAGEGDTSITVEDATGIEAGATLQISEGAGFCEAVAEAVDGAAVTLRDALETGFAAGASAEVVASYEVLGVEDQGGAGHHVWVGLRSR